ncbi:MAG: citrate (Si)-synthase, partial [Anaplasmataceae bacterium]|nr:citrate (Si)-synthase [Anaplasmataceae bacterium]
MTMATIKINDKIIELPIINGNHGIKAIDVRSLYAKYKILTYDQGLMSTAFCKSSITFIDGDKGILQYRNRDIADISSKMSYLESVHFLSQINIPFSEFIERIIKTSLVPLEVINVIKSFPRNAHPMSILIASFAVLTSVYPEFPKNDDYLIVAVGLVSPIIAAIYRHISGDDAVQQLFKENLSYADNFLLNMFGEKQSSVAGKALETILILHADHEQNASTAAVRLTSSAESHPFACLASGT